MNSRFIRTFADDLSEYRKSYQKHTILSDKMAEAIIKLHTIAHLLEKLEKTDERDTPQDSGKQ